jgi:hypothetical protein
MLVPARDVRGLPKRLAALVRARLTRCGIAARAIDAETRAMVSVAVGATSDRSVVGTMVDFAKAVPYHLDPGHWNEATLELVEERLAETPCHAARSSDRVIFPERKAPDLLRAKWLADLKVGRVVENTMNKYDAGREPDPGAWLDLDESTRMDLVVEYHRKHARRTPQIRAHSIIHTIVENQLAASETAAVQTIDRLRAEGLSRHDAIHAIGSVLAGHLHGLMQWDHSTQEDPNEAYAAALRKLTAANWYEEG